ncbi:MAG: hydrogenase nickel incorporation protein HypA [Candidatus Hadarchaeota archaeon]
MHEWALAEGVVSAALKAADERKAGRVLGIRVRVGELQQLDKKVFKFAVRQLARGTKAENLNVALEPEKSVFECNVCRAEWGFRRGGLRPGEAESVHFIPEVAHVYLRCPKCGSPDFQLKGGRGVLLEHVEMER